MNSKVGQTLADLKMQITPNIGEVRQRLKVNCKKPIEAVPCNPLDGKPCLFDLSVDPCEFNNLAGKMSKKVNDLQLLIEEYRAKSVPPINLDTSLLNDPKANPKYWNCTVNSWEDFPFDGTLEAVCPPPIM